MTDKYHTLIAAIITTLIVEGFLSTVAGLTYWLIETPVFKPAVVIIWLIGALCIAFASGRLYGRIELKQELRAIKDSHT